MAQSTNHQLLSYGYSKDKKHVYYDYSSRKRIKGADAATFEVLDIGIAKDKRHVYIQSPLGKIKKLKVADAKSFIYYQDGYFLDEWFLYNVTGQKIARLDTFDLKGYFGK